jgi:murein L,D-transpeptidase YafK
VLLASAAAAVAIALSGCNSDDPLLKSSLRAKQPLSPKIVAEIEQKGMAKESPILVRIFKEEAELEVWKQTREGRYALLKTYPICRYSGELGPKVKEGDRQAPEGFYTITPGQMNPRSSYYLAFNMGYPNAFDRAHGRTGSELMVHGDCSSRGCYAMTDEQMGEIYALAREAFFGGQKSFQVQAFPFRMTPVNMARHRANPNMRFWRMLKDGYDHFEVTRLEPKVDVCERRYVFDAETSGGGTFNPSAACPTYEIPSDIMAAVREKQHRDRIRTAALISSTPIAPVKTGTDGGMNPVYLAALNGQNPDFGRTAATTAFGTVPSHASAPRTAHPVYASKEAAAESAHMMLATAEARSESSSASGGGLIDQMTRAMGLKEEPVEQPRVLAGRPRPVASAPPSKPAAEPKSQVAVAAPPPKPAPSPAPPAVSVAAAKPVADKSAPEKPALRGSNTAVTAAARRPAVTAPVSAYTSPSTMTALTGPVMRGSQPTLSTGSFDSRWSALR